MKDFLKKFKSMVEDVPGVSPDMVWNELSYRTSGLALRLLDPYKNEEPEVAVKLTKEHLRIWARTPRDV